jgi:hypothetical protein
MPKYETECAYNTTCQRMNRRANKKKNKMKQYQKECGAG